jgi:hypothetical protein
LASTFSQSKFGQASCGLLNFCWNWTTAWHRRQRLDAEHHIALAGDEQVILVPAGALHHLEFILRCCGVQSSLLLKAISCTDYRACSRAYVKAEDFCDLR